VAAVVVVVVMTGEAVAAMKAPGDLSLKAAKSDQKQIIRSMTRETNWQRRRRCCEKTVEDVLQLGLAWADIAELRSLLGLLKGR